MLDLSQSDDAPAQVLVLNTEFRIPVPQLVLDQFELV